MADKKVAPVTGANKGIGYEIARQLGGHGFAVVLAARDVRKVNEAADQLRAEGLDAYSIRLAGLRRTPPSGRAPRPAVRDTLAESVMLLADIALNPGGVVGWIVVGLVAGFLAGRVMKGEGYGLAGDIVVGLVGALVGGFLFSFLVQGDMGLFGSILVAFVGACILIFIVRSIRGTGPRL